MLTCWRATAAVAGTRSIRLDVPCTPARTCSPTPTGRLMVLFTSDAHVQVEATWDVYQRLVAAYREPTAPEAVRQCRTSSSSLTDGMPAALAEVHKLGRTLTRRALTMCSPPRPIRHQQRPDRGHRRSPRTPPRIRPGILVGAGYTGFAALDVWFDGQAGLLPARIRMMRPNPGW